MSNQQGDILSIWSKDQIETNWVLGTVYKTEGSAQRKAGAMTLINGYGQQFGILSGGCLESDIVLNARKVMQSGQTLLLEYDGNGEDDWSYQLGIGCGGKVYIMLQPLSSQNDLGLNSLTEAIMARQNGLYYQRIGFAQSHFEVGKNNTKKSSEIIEIDNQDWLITAITPKPHLLIIGGGIDARPLVSIATEMGWMVTVADPRPANARKEHFIKAERILRKLDETLTVYINNQKVDAVVIMSHSVKLDAQALNCCQSNAI